MACSSEVRKKNSFDGKDSVESPDVRPIVNVDEERRTVEEARNGGGGNSSFAKEKSSRGEFERPQITERGCRSLEGRFHWKVEEGR